MENLKENSQAGKSSIEYPYLPEKGEIKYVPGDNLFMLAAREFAREHSLDKVMPGAAVIVKDGQVIGVGANGSSYHETNGCERVRLGCRTGEGYELCEGCHPKNHSEAKAINHARQTSREMAGADLYLWGHWWCCQPCWEAMSGAGIASVYLLEGSEVLFNREAAGNLVGRQFDESRS